MIYNLKYTAASVLAVINMSSAGFTKCADNTPITLFVYGSNINGPPMFFANGKLDLELYQTMNVLTSKLGKAYFGRGPLIDTTGIQTNITITAGYDSTQPWPITANSTTVSFNETQYLYLVPGSGSFEQLGFATNVSIPIGGVTTGFSVSQHPNLRI